MLIYRPIETPIRSHRTLSWYTLWNGPDEGLISCWERGRERALTSPELAIRCLNDELPTLGWKGGTEQIQKGLQKSGSLKYLAQWQGLRGEDLRVDLSTEPTLTCSRTGVIVTFSSCHRSPENVKARTTPQLPLVNLFKEPYRVWSKREATWEERLKAFQETGRLVTHINTELKEQINNAFDAAVYMATSLESNGLERFISDALDNSRHYTLWKTIIPSATPKELLHYKNRYPKYDLLIADFEINACGATLSEGQYLFHGGVWPAGDTLDFITDRPLSTTFCPQVALSNATHKGKAYDHDKIELLVIHASRPKTKVYPYKHRGLNLAHEKEVVFACGASLKLLSRKLVREDYPVGKPDSPLKRVPVYVLEVDAS